MSEKSNVIQTSSGRAALRVVEPGALFDRMNGIYDEVARRAFELFEYGNWVHGHDLEHWFKAESELLHPVYLQISESLDAFTVQAAVPGFTANDLEISLEPHRLTLSGRKESSDERKKGKTIYKELHSDEILRVIDLPAEVIASRPAASLKNGILELRIPKAVPALAPRVEVRAA